MSDLAAAKRAKSGVKKSQLKKLVHNYYDVIKKKDENGKIVDLNPATDSKSVWFTKKAIDELFADHGCTAENSEEFGLRVYFAVHKTGVLETHNEIPKHYHNQQTVILVPTRGVKGGKMDTDLLLDDEHLVKGAQGKGDGDPVGGEGQGVNHGKICPPDHDCGCAID